MIQASQTNSCGNTKSMNEVLQDIPPLRRFFQGLGRVYWHAMQKAIITQSKGKGLDSLGIVLGSYWNSSPHQRNYSCRESRKKHPKPLWVALLILDSGK
jgi:hypothetical protein